MTSVRSLRSSGSGFSRYGNLQLSSIASSPRRPRYFTTTVVPTGTRA